MRIFWPDIHKNLTKSMAVTFKELGHTLVTPSSSYAVKYYPPPPVKQFVWNETWTKENCIELGDNIEVVSKEELFDNPPDVLFITAYENQFEIFNEVLPKMKKGVKLCHYSGNDYWVDAYPIDTIYNYLCADHTGFVISYRNNKNYLHYRPRVDYDFFSFGGKNDSNILGTYITDYERNFPKDYNIAKGIIEKFRPIISVRSCSNLTREDVLKSMTDSCATLHIKSKEGYGFSMIESCAVGRPVFVPTQHKKFKSFPNWIVEGETGFYFNDINEFHKKIQLFLSSNVYRHSIQEKCAKKIREYVNNDEQRENLKKFLENLI